MRGPAPTLRCAEKCSDTVEVLLTGRRGGEQAGDTLLTAQKYEEELKSVESRAVYARRENENQSALLEEARRQAENAARAYAQAE